MSYTESDEVEFFCLLTVEIKVSGGTRQELRDELVTLDKRTTTAQDVYYKAISQAVSYYTKYGDNAKEDLTFLDFKLWNNDLGRGLT